MRARAPTVLLAAALLAAPTDGRGEPDEPGTASRAERGARWIRVTHPELPLAFDVPEQTLVRQVTVFSLSRARSDDRERIDETLFGVRDLGDRASTVQAVQFGFFWVTEDFLGVERDTLEILRDEIGDAARVASFLRTVFYAGEVVQLEDRGADFVDGLPARRISIARVVARGTRDERHVLGEAVVVPLSGLAALALIARYDEVSTDEERAQLFPRVFRSLRFLDSGAPLVTRASRRDHSPLR